MEQLLTREEVAKILRITPQHLSNLTKRGVIVGIRLGASIRYRTVDVSRAIDECKTR